MSNSIATTLENLRLLRDAWVDNVKQYCNGFGTVAVGPR